MVSAISKHVLWWVPLLALLVPWEATATCLTQAEAKKLVAETTKQVGGKSSKNSKKKKRRGKRAKRVKKASLKQLTREVADRTHGTASRAEAKAWDRLYDALRPLATNSAACEVEPRSVEGLTAVLSRLLANPKPPVFDIVAVQYLAQRLARGADDSWT